MTKAQMSIKPPIDKWKIVFFIFILHGLGTLMPWNIFITAKGVCIIFSNLFNWSYIYLANFFEKYFTDYKLNPAENSTTTNYSTNFMQYMGFAAQIPNLVFNWLNIFVNLG